MMDGGPMGQPPGGPMGPMDPMGGPMGMNGPGGPGDPMMNNGGMMMGQGRTLFYRIWNNL